MKLTFKYTLLLTLIFACFALASNAQNIQVEAKLDKLTIPIGDQTTLHIVAHIQAKDELTFPAIADSIAGKLQIVNAARPDTLFDKNNSQAETITRNYTLTSFTAGSYTIPQYTFHIKGGTITTDSLTIQITSVPVDTTKAIYDIKQPFAVSYTFWDWLKEHWLIVVIVLAVILAIIGIIYYLKNRPKNQVIVKKQEPIIPPHVLAINKLNELRDKKLWQQNEVKLYHSELSDTLREYLEKRYHVQAFEQTTDEIFDGIRYMDISEESRNKLRQILMLADLVKFAKQKPLPAENEQSLDNAISFIMQTKEEPLPPAAKEELPK